MSILPFLTSLGKVGEALAVWADPKRREVAKLRLAITAAENLIAIYEKSGIFKSFDDKKLEKYRIHFNKQFEAWKDGL